MCIFDRNDCYDAERDLLATAKSAVSIALSCTIFELFDVEEHRNLDVSVRITQGRCRCRHSIGGIQYPTDIPF